MSAHEAYTRTVSAPALRACATIAGFSAQSSVKPNAGCATAGSAAAPRQADAAATAAVNRNKLRSADAGKRARIERFADGVRPCLATSCGRSLRTGAVVGGACPGALLEPRLQGRDVEAGILLLEEALGRPAPAESPQAAVAVFGGEIG